MGQVDSWEKRSATSLSRLLPRLEERFSDRRAGRIATDLNQRLCQKIRDKVFPWAIGQFLPKNSLRWW